MSFRQSFLFSLLVGFVVTTAFFVGFWTRDRLATNDNFPVLQEAHTLLLKHGLVTPPPGSALEYGMVRGMLQAYGDPFTSFSEPAQAELQSNRLQGSFGGIGANLERDTQGFHILYPYPDSPAARAGVQEADRILGIDEFQVSPETTEDDILAAIRGPIGTEVVLTLARLPDYVPFNISIQRDQFSLPSVIRYLEPRQSLLGIIKINLIASTTADEIQKAINELQVQGATHFALDLRSNYGGLLKQGVEIARLFLSEGVIINEEHKNQPVLTHKVEQPGPFIEIPLVVLIDHNTASSAEIIAGALQSNGRAPLIGMPSYGKGSLQVVFQLQDQSSIQITGGRWWIPGLKIPQIGQGLQPDYTVDPPTGDPDPAIQKAIEILFSNP